MKKFRWGKLLGRAVLGFGVVLGIAVAIALVAGWRAYGHGAEGDRKTRMEHSPEWTDGHFENPQPIRNHFWPTVKGMFETSADASPHSVIPVQTPDLSQQPGSGLRVTWFGHSSTLIEIDGLRVLTDPLFSDRISPLSFIGPTRWYPPPVPFKSLPHVDAE